MKLLAVRDLNTQDPIGGLGPKVERPSTPPAQPPAPIPTSTPGVYQSADGKLHTNIPENDALRVHDSVCVNAGTVAGRFSSSAPSTSNISKTLNGFSDQHYEELMEFARKHGAGAVDRYVKACALRPDECRGVRVTPHNPVGFRGGKPACEFALFADGTVVDARTVYTFSSGKVCGDREVVGYF